MRRRAMPAASVEKTQKGTGRAMVASPRNFSRWASIASCRNSWRGISSPPILKQCPYNAAMAGKKYPLEVTGGIVLIAATIAALVLATWVGADAWHHAWERELAIISGGR